MTMSYEHFSQLDMELQEAISDLRIQTYQKESDIAMLKIQIERLEKERSELRHDYAATAKENIEQN